MAGINYPFNPFQNTKMETTAQFTAPTTATTEDFLPLLGTDYVEFYVGNAKHEHYCTICSEKFTLAFEKSVSSSSVVNFVVSN